jgi:hypothetical protein
MAQKSAKKKPKKAAKASPDASVMGALPATRPIRLGGDRRAATTKAASATRPSKARAAKPKAAKLTKTATPKAKHIPQPPRTEAPPAGWQTPRDGDGRRDGGPVELVTTAVQAAGELAQFGFAVGGQMLRRAAKRLPGR